MSLRIGSANIKDTLSAGPSVAALHKVSAACDFLGLQEWPGRRNAMLSDQGALLRGPLIRKRKIPEKGWVWARPLIGGGPIGARVAAGGRLKACHVRILVGPGRVEGSQPGVPRRSFLPASLATECVYEFDGRPDLHVFDIHLTAEVQRGKVGYRKDMPKRVNRHRRERAKLQRLVDKRLENHRDVAVIGDTNYHQMPIHGLTGWWKAQDPDADKGTEGNRAIDIVSVSWGAPDSVQILTSASDHNHPTPTWETQ